MAVEQKRATEKTMNIFHCEYFYHEALEKFFLRMNFDLFLYSLMTKLLFENVKLLLFSMLL